MADAAGFGMEKGPLKIQLTKAKDGPISCAVGKGKEAGVAYLMLDHVKQPKALQTLLEGKFQDIKDPRRGTVTINPDVNAKLVVFHLNKPASGLAPRLVKVLKTVGFNKVKFDFEDGSPSEESEEAEEESEGAPAAPPDANAMKHRLTGLVQALAPAIAADPSHKDAWLALAKEAQGLLGGGDLAGAERKIDELETMLPKQAAAGPAAEVKSGTVAYAKSRLAWLGVRKKMEGDIQKLRDELIQHYQDENAAAEINAAVSERLDPVLASLDESLADTLDNAINAADPAQRAKLIQTARGIIKKYQDFVAGEPIFAELDANPFVPMQMQATLNATLTTLSAAIR